MQHDLLHTVITGDVVGSTDMPGAARARLPTVLKDVYGTFRSGREAALPHDIDIFRGDSWQVYVADPRFGLALAMYIRAALREQLNVDVRSALAIDHVDFVDASSVSASDGLAFRRSGRVLSELDRGSRFRILPPEHTIGNRLHVLVVDGIAEPVDFLAQRWTQAQAQVIRQMLHTYPTEPRQQDVADAWHPAPISQPAINKHLRKAGWEWVSAALGRYQQFVDILIDPDRLEASQASQGGRPSTILR